MAKKHDREPLEMTHAQYIDEMAMRAAAVSEAAKALYRLVNDMWTINLGVLIVDLDDTHQSPPLVNDSVSEIHKTASAVLEPTLKLKRTFEFIQKATG